MLVADGSPHCTATRLRPSRRQKEQSPKNTHGDLLHCVPPRKMPPSPKPRKALQEYTVCLCLMQSGFFGPGMKECHRPRAGTRNVQKLNRAGNTGRIGPNQRHVMSTLRGDFLAM